MDLPVVHLALETCRRHLQSVDAIDSFDTEPEIEHYLTQYLLVLTYAQFENAVREMLVRRFGRTGDTELERFAESQMRSLLRGIRTSDIADLLGSLGDSRKKAFKDKMDANPKAETFFNNIVTNRHGVAHRTGSTVTLRELETFYSEGHVVLDAIQEVLGN